MKNSILIISMLCVFNSFAQEEKTNLNLTRQGFGVHAYLDMGIGFVNAKGITEGSPYYFDDWNTEGIVYTKEKGRFKIKKVNINLYNNTLDALYDQNYVFTFDTKNLVRITIDNKIFRVFNLDEKQKILEQFYKDKFSVYRYYSINYAKKSVNPMVNRRTNKYIKKSKYFLYKEGELISIKLTKKSFSKLFESESLSQEAILKFIDKYEISLKKEADLIKALKFVTPSP